MMGKRIGSKLFKGLLLMALLLGSIPAGFAAAETNFGEPTPFAGGDGNAASP